MNSKPGTTVIPAYPGILGSVAPAVNERYRQGFTTAALSTVAAHDISSAGIWIPVCAGIATIQKFVLSKCHSGHRAIVSHIGECYVLTRIFQNHRHYGSSLLPSICELQSQPITMNITRKPHENDVKKLLASAQLPIVDIKPDQMEHFFAAWVGSSLEGVVGLELYGSVALLRSLAVALPKRASGIGSELLASVEKYAVEKGVHSLFLLTTTAESYFKKRGYSQLMRKEAPEVIQQTAEFTSICPASSIFMVKLLTRS